MDLPRVKVLCAGQNIIEKPQGALFEAEKLTADMDLAGTDFLVIAAVGDTAEACKVAEAARRKNILTVAVAVAGADTEGLRAYADKTIVVFAGGLVQKAVEILVEPITRPSALNTELEDIAPMLRGAGEAYFGYGASEGENREVRAVKGALGSSVLSGAKSAIVYVAGASLTLGEIKKVANYVNLVAEGGVNLQIAAGIKDGLNGKLEVSVLAVR